MKKIYDRFERNALIGNKNLQWLFESMHRFALRCMNYDQVQSITTSGELFVLEHLKQKLTIDRKTVVFDVGANVGDYSIIVSKQFPHAHVFAFEALPGTFELLKKNAEGFNNITPVNKALGAAVEEKIFYSDGRGSHLSSFYSIHARDGDRTSAETVLLVSTIDSFCEQHGIEVIHFLKIDVEGHELEVLKGAEKMLRSRKIHAIQFEFGENYLLGGAHLSDIYTYLHEYRISRVLRNGLRAYEKYSKHWEIYLSANYLAELK